MNKIIINQEEVTKIASYKGDQYFDKFIFDEFKVVLMEENSNWIYEVKINGNINEVTYGMNQKYFYRDCKFVFAEDENGVYVLERPSGKLIEYFKDEYNFDEKAVSDFITLIEKVESLHIYQLKQYIMNESYKRATVQKVSTDTRISESNDSKEKKNYKRTKKGKQFLLGDIVEYVSRKHCKHIINCECWGVRGHFRHYKDGRIVWIDAYKKGSKRNIMQPMNNNIYVI